MTRTRISWVSTGKEDEYGFERYLRDKRFPVGEFECEICKREIVDGSTVKIVEDIDEDEFMELSPGIMINRSRKTGYLFCSNFCYNIRGLRKKWFQNF